MDLGQTIEGRPTHPIPLHQIRAHAGGPLVIADKVAVAIWIRVSRVDPFPSTLRDHLDRRVRRGVPFAGAHGRGTCRPVVCRVEGREDEESEQSVESEEAHCKQQN